MQRFCWDGDSVELDSCEPVFFSRKAWSSHTVLLWSGDFALWEIVSECLARANCGTPWGFACGTQKSSRRDTWVNQPTETRVHAMAHACPARQSAQQRAVRGRSTCTHETTLPVRRQAESEAIPNHDSCLERNVWSEKECRNQRSLHETQNDEDDMTSVALHPFFERTHFARG